MYAKIYLSMWDGSLGGCWQAWATFVFMLCACDRNGFVFMTEEAIARRTSLPLEAVREGIAVLERPDPTSRLEAEEGRRIMRTGSTGWFIVNYEHYRALFDAESRRETWRNAKARARQADLFPEVSLSVPERSGNDSGEFSQVRLSRGRGRGKGTTPSSLRSDGAPELESEVPEGVVEPSQGDGAASSCPEQPVGAESDRQDGWSGLSLPCSDSTDIGFTTRQVQRWAALFPGVDVRHALMAMRAWLEANPRRAKTRRGIKSFVVNWLSRAQDSGRGERAKSGTHVRTAADRRYLEANKGFVQGGGDGKA